VPHEAPSSPHAATGSPAPERRRRLGIHGELVASAAVLVVIFVAFGLVGDALLTGLEGRLLAVYSDRVVPVRELKSVSDRFAVDIVDTVHKVCAGRLDREAGAARIRTALGESAASWQVVDQSRLAEAAADDPETAARYDAAKAAGQRALALTEAGDLEGLERFRTTEMYPAIDPLTARLERLVREEVAGIDSAIHAARARLRAVRALAAVVLVAVGAAALAATLGLSRRLVRSISSMEAVVRAVAGGDLGERVHLGGSDELSEMAGGIDRMIDALARSRQALEERSAELARAAQEARSASTAKSLFLSSMSHELRTPLNVIIGYAQVLAREGGRSHSDRIALERVLEAGQHLLGLVEDVLSIARIEAGKLLVRSQPYSPVRLVETVQHLLGSRAERKGLALHVSVDPALPEWVEGDEGKLRQVLVNLVGNAIKFTSRGEVRLSVRHDGDDLHASVLDTGPGIPPEETARLFETFFQGGAGHAAAEGSGLGLFISRSLVRLMGGDIEVRSAVGEGTEFRLHVEAPAVAGPARAVPGLRAPRVPEGVEIAPMLVVDDRHANREVLGRLLRNFGLEVEEAGDGLAAVEACARRRHSLVWMDLRMPGLNGIDAMRRIRAADGSAGRDPHRIVAITASVVEMDRETVRREVFDDLCTTPCGVVVIVAHIARHVGIDLVETDVGPATSEVGAEGWDGLAEVPAETRARLLGLLVAGDVGGALALTAGIGPAPLAERLRSALESFEHDALIGSLRAMDAGSGAGGGAAT